MAQSPAGTAAPLIPADQVDSLVAPIALYPDPLLAQTLAASTYPLEIIQLQQFLARNPGLKDKALADAVQKEPWDPSIQSLAATPEVVKRLADDIQWTTDLGNAFLAQEADVMAAVQRMRKSAMDKDVLKTTEQQVVQTQVIESKTVVVIEPANPQVIYVPTYSPVVVWGPPVYPYPPIYYPPPPPAGSLFLAFGVGVAMGAWWGGGGGWGYNCGWGGNNVTINNNNTFIRNTNIRNGNTNVGNGNRWQHQPQHRGGAPYRDRATADRYGGAARGDSLANRQTNARNQIGKQGGNVASARPPQGAGMGNRGGGGSGAGGGAEGPAIVPAAGLVPGAVPATEASSIRAPEARTALVPRAVPATEPASSTRAREARTAPVAAAPIASATGTCRAVVPAAAETAMPSVAAVADTTARAPVHRAAAGLRARSNLAAERRRRRQKRAAAAPEAVAARAVSQRRAERTAGAHR